MSVKVVKRADRCCTVAAAVHLCHRARSFCCNLNDIASRCSFTLRAGRRGTGCVLTWHHDLAFRALAPRTPVTRHIATELRTIRISSTDVREIFLLLYDRTAKGVRHCVCPGMPV